MKQWNLNAKKNISWYRVASTAGKIHIHSTMFTLKFRSSVKVCDKNIMILSQPQPNRKSSVDGRFTQNLDIILIYMLRETSELLRN